MDEKDYSRFKINLEDDGEEEVEERAKSPHATPDDQRVKMDKLNRRITIITIAIPLLTVILFIYAYVDIKKSVTDIHATGLSNFQKLSQDLEKSLSDLSEKSEKLKQMVEAETKAFEKKTALFSKKLKTNTSGIKNLEKKISSLQKTDDLKTNVKDFESYISRVEKQISALESESKTNRSETEKELADLKDRLANMFEVLQKLKIDMVSFSENQTNQITRETLDNALERQNEKFQHELEVISEKFEKQVSEIRNTRPAPQKPGQKVSPPPQNDLLESDIN